MHPFPTHYKSSRSAKKNLSEEKKTYTTEQQLSYRRARDMHRHWTTTNVESSSELLQEFSYHELAKSVHGQLKLADPFVDS